MKITIVQGAFFPVPPEKGGAVEKAWFALGKEFARAGHTVTHVSRQFPPLPLQGSIEGVHHIRVPGFDQPQSPLLLKILDLAYTLRALSVIPASDIIVTNTFWLPILAPLRRNGHLYVHVARYPKHQMRLYKHAARLQTVSTSIAGIIAQQAPELAKKVKVIPNPLPDGMPDGLSSHGAREKIILYAGRIHPEKGIHLLLDAFLSSDLLVQGGWRLRLVGPWQTDLGGGGQGYWNELQRKAGTSPAIEWIGMVTDSLELQKHYQSAKIFVYPSLADRGESFGLAPLEAMSNGCAVVVSSLQCFHEFISAGETGLVFNHQVANPSQELATKIELLANSREMLESISQAGMNKARTFSVETIAEQYLTDFTAILNKAESESQS